MWSGKLINLIFGKVPKRFDYVADIDPTMGSKARKNLAKLKILKSFMSTFLQVILPIQIDVSFSNANIH